LFGDLTHSSYSSCIVWWFDSQFLLLVYCLVNWLTVLTPRVLFGDLTHSSYSSCIVWWIDSQFLFQLLLMLMI